MTQKPSVLVEHLAVASWNHLVALLAAHQLPRSAQQKKAEFVHDLGHHLLQPTVLNSIIAQLDAFGKDALRQLLIAEGALPVHTFEKRFGPVRPYRPWRQDEAQLQPWLAPISTTEQLWYLGLIFHDPPKPKPGFVQHYVLPADLIPALRELLRQPAAAYPTTPVPHPGRHGLLDHHLAIWLATVHAPQKGKAVKPVHGRWLPPSVVALLCTRLGLGRPLGPAPGFRPPKSERHLPYLAFLHYLAVAAELVAVTPSAWQVTPAGWAWLAADSVTRRRHLYDAWRTAPLEVALPFSFPWEPLTPQARALLLDPLVHLSDEQPILAEQVVSQWRLLDKRGFLPEPALRYWYDDENYYDPLVELLTGPLHWLGLVSLHQRRKDGQTLTAGDDPQTWLVAGPEGTPPVTPPPAVGACTMPKLPVNTILAPLTVQPLHLVRLARFCDWAIADAPTATPHTFTLAPERIAGLAAQGSRPEELLEHLTAALGRPPSRRVVQRVRAWARPGQQLRLRPLLVLEADESELLAQLRRHKLVRRRLGEIIAPNRVTLNPTDAQALAQTLRTLGYYVEPPATLVAAPLSPPADDTAPEQLSPPETVGAAPGGRPPDTDGRPPGAAPTEAPSSSEEAQEVFQEDRQEAPRWLSPPSVAPTPVGLAPSLQWFLITLYQGLGQHLSLPLDLPWEVRQALRVQLSALQQASAESAAAALLESLQAALNGYLQIPIWHLPPTADPEPIIRTALEAGRDLQIRYWGASDDHATTRRVTPYWIEERHHILYLIGWCHLRQEERTFRLDRIEAVETLLRTAVHT